MAARAAEPGVHGRETGRYRRSESGMRIIQGCAQDVLPTLPERSVHCVVTSPPYWSLRDYGIAPSIWGGDPECAHSWQNVWHYREGGNLVSSSDAFSEPGRQNAARLQETRWREHTWCSRCGAWRGCLGLEPSVADYISHLVLTFREVWRVLRDDGTLWLNLGDAYAGSWGNFHPTGKGGQRPKRTERYARRAYRDTRFKPPAASAAGPFKPKDLLMLPHRVAIALQEAGWTVRSDVVWAKPNPVPESVGDRPTRAHEYVFLLAKARRYFYDADAVREPAKRRRASGAHSRFEQDLTPVSHKRSMKAEPLNGAHGTMGHDGNGHRYESVYSHPLGRNLRSVWEIASRGFPDAHFATFPEKLVEPCIRAGTSSKGCCPGCGTPWRRITEVEYVNPGNTQTNGPRSHFTARLEAERTTVDWQPGCDCDAGEPVPCTVLDPFAGSGTALRAAARLGRDAIGIEPKAEYVAMIRRRLHGVQTELFS